MRDRIKTLARDLLIQQGYRGLSFGDLAAALDTTRANIHYHFGHKQTLVDEVSSDYLQETIHAMDLIWANPNATLAKKIKDNIEFSRRRYAKYNRPGHERHPWSLITRMRQDSNSLSPKMREALLNFDKELYRTIANAVLQARSKREFVETVPIDDVTLQLFNIANNASPITQNSGDFDRLEQLYLGFSRIITHAFGTVK